MIPGSIVPAGLLAKPYTQNRSTVPIYTYKLLPRTLSAEMYFYNAQQTDPRLVVIGEVIDTV